MLLETIRRCPGLLAEDVSELLNVVNKDGLGDTGNKVLKLTSIASLLHDPHVQDTQLYDEGMPKVCFWLLAGCVVYALVGGY